MVGPRKLPADRAARERRRARHDADHAQPRRLELRAQARALPGLGELDDLTAVLLSLKMFVDLAPPEIVREHLNNLAKRVAKRQTPSEPYIDVPYHVVDDGKPKKESR